MYAAAIVLAGGLSTRLGHDKASTPLLGVPLLTRVLRALNGAVDERLVVAREGQDLSWLDEPDVRIVTDVYAQRGPLGGLYTGFLRTDAAAAIVLGCDTPLVSPALLQGLIRLLARHDAVVPMKDGLPQPLCAAYARQCIDAARARLERRALRLSSLLDDLDVLYLQPEVWREWDAGGLSFLNLNRPEDIQRAEAILKAQSESASGTK